MNVQSANFMIVGVGGQGTLLASKILGSVLMNCGLDVKVSEVHGMSQRGGSVVTYVRCGKKVSSPIIELGEADYLLSFECCEGARWLPYLKIGGKMLLNTQRIDPMSVITGAAAYPQDIVKTLQEKGCDVIAVDAFSLAEQAGSSKAVNVVLIGMLSAAMDIDETLWLQAIAENVKPAFLQMNEKAFMLGRNAALNV